MRARNIVVGTDYVAGRYGALVARTDIRPSDTELKAGDEGK